MKAPMKILLAAGARPNFMKIAPLWRELRRYPDEFDPILVHTGQHYDPAMSGVFIEDMELPAPEHSIAAGPGSNAEQTARIVVGIERICLETRPSLVVVVGDTTSTLACAVTAKKMDISVAHVEAGLRSRDWTMPEETNRVVTDRISDLLFTPSRDADQNLIDEGVARDRIHFVGNIMIDALVAARAKASVRGTCARLCLAPETFGLLTLHRPSNVDTEESLRAILRGLASIDPRVPIVFPVHPRTRKNIVALGLEKQFDALAGLRRIEPLGYLDFLDLELNAKFVITDSGGIQEETTWLGIPCLTLRKNTERPITISHGTNALVEPAELSAAVAKILLAMKPRAAAPELWDGAAAPRIVRILRSLA